MSVVTVQNYLDNGFKHVPGWCSARFMQITSHLSELMNEAGVVGGACEIGVYQGKFLIGLAHAVDGRPSLGIDIFDSQELNVDKSGAGRTNMLAGFRDNVSKFGTNIAEISANSFDLTLGDTLDILKRFGSFQLFSVDGGHLPEHVVNDYYFAESVTLHGGAIIFDDFGNPAWPGVMDGVAHIFTGRRPKFVPLLVGQNKLLLTGISYHQRYLKGLRSRITEAFPKQTTHAAKLFGFEVLAVSGEG